MEKKSQTFMDLNRETAMRLWNASFGNQTKVTDFAGRTIAKGAYNDRNSQLGWNVDHILPQSKGGTTADHNLICCHILTNDEKANKFPCFNANGTAFEIIKVQRHYEIRPRNNNPKKQENTPKAINFYDSANGLRFFKKQKDKQNKCRFVGTVIVQLNRVTNNAVIDFIEELFKEESISFGCHPNMLFNLSQGLRINICNYDIPLQEDTQELLDKCVLLYTYLSRYFTECGYVQNFRILCRLDCFKNKNDLYNHDPRSFSVPNYSQNSLYINKAVWEHTSARDEVDSIFRNDFMEYSYIFTKLAKNLEKEASGK